MRDPRAGNFVLAGHAGDIGTGAADPSALHNGGSPSSFRQMPGYEFATGSTAEDEGIVSVNHGDVPFSACQSLEKTGQLTKGTSADAGDQQCLSASSC